MFYLSASSTARHQVLEQLSIFFPPSRGNDHLLRRVLVLLRRAGTLRRRVAEAPLRRRVAEASLRRRVAEASLRRRVAPLLRRVAEGVGCFVGVAVGVGSFVGVAVGFLVGGVDAVGTLVGCGVGSLDGIVRRDPKARNDVEENSSTL